MQAIEICSELIENGGNTSRNEAVFRFYRGKAFLDTKQYDAALNDFNIVIRYIPDLSDAFLRRGDVYRETNKLPWALRDYTSALEHKPQDIRIFNNRAITYTRNRQYSKALSDMNELMRIAALKFEPLRFAHFANRAHAYFGLGRYEEAISDYTFAIGITPNSVSALNWRGKTHERMENRRSSRDYYLKQVDILPRQARAAEKERQ